MSGSYKAAGVDIQAAEELKKRISGLARNTFGPGVLSEIGSYGGLFALPEDLRQQVLVASTDGVGTKLKVAALAGRHETVGVDLVNHCINDILVQGAYPLFFLDYLAFGKLVPDVAEQVVQGLAAACKAEGCALLGGETAEMPGMYAEGEYDLAGTIIGLVEKERVLPRTGIVEGDLLLGLASHGLHTNGYSLVRRICLEEQGLSLHEYLPELGTTLGEELLRPHRCYARLVRPLLDAGLVKGLIHLTGGGYQGNIPRVLPQGLGVRIDSGSWPDQPIFSFLAERGGIDREEMFRTFNMGLGLLIIAGQEQAGEIRRRLLAAEEPPYQAGAIVAGEGVEIL